MLHFIGELAFYNLHIPCVGVMIFLHDTVSASNDIKFIDNRDINVTLEPNVCYKIIDNSTGVEG